MKFTASKDGVERMTVRVEYRITRGDVAFALALAHHDVSHRPELAVATDNKRDVVRHVRALCEAHGPPRSWPDAPDSAEFEGVRAAAEAVVADLWDDYEVPT